MNLKDFNVKLQGFMKDAKILERSNPKKAKSMWLKICEFVLEFSKQPQIERNFRLRLWKQIDAILKRIKGDEIVTQNAKIPFTNSSIENNIEFNVNDLPSVPERDLSQSEDTAENERKITTGDFTTISVKKEQKPSNDSFFERIMKMEKELKKLPDSFKEVPPQPYSPDKSIIPPQINSNVSSKHLDIQKADKGLFEDQSLNLDTNTVDVYKGTKDFEEIKDPFGPDHKIKDSEKDKSIHCYACGTIIKIGQNQCPKCGTKL